MPYNPMKKHMEKLDDWGSSTSKKFAATRDAGPSASISDRFNIARGKDDRWEKSKLATAVDTEEDQTNIVPQRSVASSSRVAHLPKAPNNFIASKAPPPPPPMRTATGGSIPSAAASPPPAAFTRGKAPAPPPPPALPRRMDNENGTDHPPPSYGFNTANDPSQPSYIEFSKFTEEDKLAFFTLLDEFFASRSGTASSAGESSFTRNSKVLHSANLPSLVQPKVTRDALKPSGPVAKPSIFPSTKSSPSFLQISQHNPSTVTYPRLSTSNLPASEPCSALQCSTFFCYPDSYPEWSGVQPWFIKPNANPSSLINRNDVARMSSWMYSGNNYCLLGCALFADLSHLWWEVSWDSTRPADTVSTQVAYRKPPGSWNDEERLTEASKGFGDWLAGFAETNAANRTPVGDGECWTLAAEAIKYTNDTAKLTESNRLMKTIGRTHGFLLYAGKADELQGQCGRWRGGDRIRAHGGGIRRGDIVEWRTVKIRIKGSAPGSWATLGAPDHTAIVVADSPVPERLSFKDKSGQIDGQDDYYSILGVSKTATQAEIRGAYLQGARQHHPDKSGGSNSDHYIQQLNEAHAALSDSARRAKYDESLRGQFNNSSRVTAEVDLDSFEAIESQDGFDGVTFYYPCRCGNGFYIDEQQLENGQDIIACSGCSEQIRVIWQDGPAKEQVSGKDDDDDQPLLSPWELDSITVIEQSAGKVPTRCTYDLSKDSFTKGDMWVYRPVWESEYLGGPLDPTWPPNLAGWEQLK